MKRWLGKLRPREKGEKRGLELHPQRLVCDGAHTNWEPIVILEIWPIRRRAEGREEQYGTYLAVDRGCSIEIKDIYGYHYKGDHTGKGVNLPDEHVRLLSTGISQNKEKQEDHYRPISST
jgi:hypothetical protein